MGWKYDPNTKATGDGQDILRRTDLEEAAERLWEVGIRNQRVIEDVLKALSGLSHSEVRFNLTLSGILSTNAKRSSLLAWPSVN